ncbi:UNVERIFIED_CONTAM: hypothetical protein FKN15_026148 [Acipenser sinensis]
MMFAIIFDVCIIISKKIGQINNNQKHSEFFLFLLVLYSSSHLLSLIQKQPGSVLRHVCVCWE